MTTFYEVGFNTNTDTLFHSSRYFNTKRAAIKWSNYLAKQKYVTFSQVWLGSVGGILVHEKHNLRGIIMPFADHKTICRNLAPEGWKYTGFSDGFYTFQTGDYSSGFKEMRCIPEDLTIKNLKLMASLNVTR